MLERERDKLCWGWSFNNFSENITIVKSITSVNNICVLPSGAVSKQTSAQVTTSRPNMSHVTTINTL